MSPSASDLAAIDAAWARILEVINTMPEIIIRHPKTEAEYGIQSGDFRRGKHYRDPKTGELQTFEAAGFEIVSYMDGSPYEAPAPRGEAKPDAEPKTGEHAP